MQSNGTARTAAALLQPMARPWRVEIFAREPAVDSKAHGALKRLHEAGTSSVRSVRVGRGYLLSPLLAARTVQTIVERLLVDPVLDRATLLAPSDDAAPLAPGVHRLCIARKPGVMDPVASSVMRALRRSLLADKPEETARVGYFQVIELEGALSRAELERIARQLFANDVVDDIHLDASVLMLPAPAKAKARSAMSVPLRHLDESALLELSRAGQLSLSATEMRAIQAHYQELGREPSACELETIAQTWSEHCKHKTFTGRIDFDGELIDNLLKQTIKRATLELNKPWCVSVFHDNAGIIEFLPASSSGSGDAGGTGWNVCFKVETHNHPSAIDPFGGAGTGVGGVIRDILGVGLGAKPIATTDAFFVGPLDLPASQVPKGCMHPARILRGVVAGVRDYGNPMGIPTVNGGLWTHARYVGNPLVYAGTVGLLPAACSFKSVQKHDRIVVVGGRTGRDGIHGATFSSIELAEESQVVSSSAVQIGDPITEKRVQDALLLARDLGLYRAITDCGAGGLSSAVGEMGAELGARVHLERVPLKYPGLAAHEIWISEAQERMVLAVDPAQLAALLAIFEAEDCDATDIGEFTGNGRLELLDDGERVGDLDMHFLHEGTPRPVRRATARAPRQEDLSVPACADPARMLHMLLAHPDVSSREWIVRQYDHEVQGTSVIKPHVGARGDGPGNASVLQPLWDSARGIAIACGASPRYGLLDPWAMATASIDEALRNAVAVGGDPEQTAILDNFSWGNCEKPEHLGDLVLASRACYAAAKAFGTPFISGKDSLNNEFKTASGTIAIPPTLYVSALAIVPDVARSVTMDLKRSGNVLYIVGMTHAELGASVYFEQLGREQGRVPRPDLALAPAALRAVHRAIATGLVRACHDLSEGGLAVAAAEMAFAGDLGLDVDLERMPLAPLPDKADELAVRLFSESCTRFLIEVEPEHCAAFEALFARLDLARLGTVTASGRLVLRSGARVVLESPLESLRSAHHGGFQG